MLQTSTKWPVFLIVAVAGLAALFTIPYHFPPATMTVSGSYDWGFNNTIGILILGAVCFFYLVAGYFSAADAAPFDAPLKSTGGAAVTRRDWLVCVGVSAVLILILAVLSGDFGFGDPESEQFVPAMQRLADGQRVYSDFDFYYGPWLLFVPYLGYLAVSLFGGSVADGYFLGLFILQLLGLAQLRFLINHMPMSDRHRRITFYAAALATLPVHAGINLILFRFITVAWGLLLISRIPADQWRRRASTAAGLAALTYGVSPEYGIILTIVFLVLAALAWIEGRRLESAAMAVVAILAPMVFRLLFPGIFNTIAVYAQGGWRWPFVPSIGMLAFFTAMFVLSFAIGTRIRNLRGNVVYLTLCLAALGSLPAALGRGDPMHLVLNGFMILLLAFSFVSVAGRRRVIAAYGGVMVLAFALLLNFSWLWLYRALYLDRIVQTVGTAAAVDTIRNVASKAEAVTGRNLQPFVQELERRYTQPEAVLPTLRESERFIAPMQLSDAMYRQLRAGRQLQPLYFKTFTIISTREEAERALAEFRANRDKTIIAPESFLKLDQPAFQPALINVLFMTRYNRVPYRNGAAVRTPPLNFVRENYVISERVGGYLVLRPKQPPAVPSGRS